MTEIIIYALVAILLLAASLWLFRKGASRPVGAAAEDQGTGLEQLEGSSLRLAERIFDASDCEWLSKELCFPEAAVVLARHRKSLAIQWLKAFRNSFKDLVRLPEPVGEGSASAAGPASWKLLWLTLRFHFLINYALLMVGIFGPYHRMVPILGTLQSLRKLGFWKANFKQAGAGRIS
jgi:hypothetical protein